MTDHQRKFVAALAELERTKIWPSNYNPPLLRLQRRLGWPARPPHYAPFWGIVVGYGIWFGVVWGLLMWFAAWRGQGFLPVVAIGTAAFAGALFGGMMALYYRISHRKHGLSRWEDL